MSEIKPLVKVIIISLVIGILALLLLWVINPGGSDRRLAVDEYRATLSEDGKLVENYTYDVGVANKYHMLYRYWEVPLSSTPLPIPSVQLLDLIPPEGKIGYMKDNRGDFTTYGEKPDVSTVNEMKYRANNNEVGVFSYSYLMRGKYTVDFTFQLHPPIEYDNQWTHLNLKLAGSDHVSYGHVRIIVPATYADHMYVYPPSLVTEKNGDTVEITGSVAGNENLAVEFLIPNTAADKLRAVSGKAVHQDYISDLTTSAHLWYSIPYTLAYFLKYSGMAAVLATPFLLVFLYLRFGREKKFTIPAYFSTTPNTALRPWQVNFLFRHNAGMLDEDALYATLLDLQRKKMIALTEKADQKHLEIRVLSPETTDVYEKKVLDLLTTYAEDGVFDTGKVEKLVNSFDTRGVSCGLMIRRLTRHNPDPSLVSRYIVDNSKKFRWFFIGGIVMILICLALYGLDTMLGYILAVALVLWIVVIIQLFIAYKAPPALFGTWKEDHYREKLEWDSFEHFLSDLAMIKKYTPADMAMWGEWLVYGTALGVGENVEKAMRALNVPLPTTGISSQHSRMLLAFTPMITTSVMGRGGRGGGGAWRRFRWRGRIRRRRCGRQIAVGMIYMKNFFCKVPT
jgi:uncharacterized membrane protein